MRDRIATASTARALLSWRLALGLVVAVVLVLVGLNPVAASLIGLAAYGLAVLAATPGDAAPTTVDPFALSEPWRHFVQGAQRSRQALTETVRGVEPGPLRDRLADIAARLDAAIDESGRIARRGDEIDEAVNRIDPVRLRSRLTTLQSHAGAAAGTEAAPTSGSADAAVASVQSQLATADRLKALSASTADHLRLTQARLDELVARAAEVSVGIQDSDAYASDVDELVVELEALRQAVAETQSIDDTARDGTAGGTSTGGGSSAGGTGP